jgi:uncharacterized protein YndB with AHSA1/START domain
MELVTAGVTVDTPPERAFEDGFAYERGPRGFTVHWGRVTGWDPPARLVLLWQIAGDRSPQPDPEKSSEVEVRFTERDGGTRVDGEHREWERHGDGAREYRDGFEEAGAWPYALERFAAAAG